MNHRELLPILLSVAGVLSPIYADPPIQHPIVLTTAVDLERARERIGEPRGTFADCWKKMRERAEQGLTHDAKPYRGDDHVSYHRAGTADALHARNLAIVSRLADDRRMTGKAKEILLEWSSDTEQYPFSLSRPSHSAGLVIGRVVVMFADAYSILYEHFDEKERNQIERWLKSLAGQIRISQTYWIRGSLPKLPPPYLGGQEFNNHLSAHCMGLAAIGYATADEEIIEYALTGRENPRNLRRMIAGAIVGSGRDLYRGDPTLTQRTPKPQRGELYDRYRTIQGKGLHYCQLHLRLLSLTALIARNNNHPYNFFKTEHTRKQSLKESFDFYSEFVLTHDMNARTGYYSGDKSVDSGFLPLYEIAHRVYPDHVRSRLILETRSRVQFDPETFGWTAPLIHGAAGINSRIGAWNFNDVGEMEGWQILNGLDGNVQNGELQLRIIANDPGLISPDRLGLSAGSYSKLLVRMQNETNDERANVFFVTDDHPSFTDSHIFFTIQPNDTQMRDYVIDLHQHERWNGIVQQIRVDVVHSATSGRVAIDAIRLIRADDAE